MSLLGEDAKQETWQAYMADVGRMIVGGMSGGKSTYPWWREVIAENRPAAQQTGQEIFDGIVESIIGKR